VTDTGHMVLEWNGEVVCDIPLGPLADDAPEYDRPHMSLDEYKAWAQVKPLGDVPESTDIAADLLKLMASPNLASRRWIWEQYDQSVGGDTVQRPGGDAAVVRVHGTKKALAITTDCTPRYCYADPYEGGKQAIAEAYRNLCAVGAKPLAVTNCLNFGNPQRPEIMAQFVECLRGMGDACRALDFPIVSGNVSLYNESKATGGGSAILPTPAIGGVGLLEDWERSATIAFKAEGEHIYLVGRTEIGRPGEYCGSHLGQSLWLQETGGRNEGPPPPVDLEAERKHGEFIRLLVRDHLATAVHDVSDGGIAVALAEMALAGDLGADTQMFGFGTRDAFGEDQGRYIVTTKQSVDLEEMGRVSGVPVQWLGEVVPDKLSIRGEQEFLVGEEPQEGVDKSPSWSLFLADLRAAHESFFPKLMGSELTPEF
jgi:phosphoribosylformylglycinamidine synthase